jgi:signal transduction histidine kinase
LAALRTQLKAIVVYAATTILLIASGSAALVAASGPSVSMLVAAAGACLLVVVIALVRGGSALDTANARLAEEQEREVERAVQRTADEVERQHASHLDMQLLMEKMPGEIAGRVSAAVGKLITDALHRGNLAVPTQTPAAGLSPSLEPFAQRVMQSILEHAAADAERRWKDVVLNLTRRVQVLLHKTVQYVDVLENDVEDGALLKRVFRVDQSLMLTIRRLESILMSLGAPIQRFSQPQDIYGVLQSAVSMIEHYKRVDLPLMLKGSIVGEAAQDISHMLAELLENATVFSPPNTRVLVSARPTRDALRIEISDSGLPVPTEVVDRLEQLINARHFSVTDHASDGRTGLSVVAIVARRYRIRVKLTPSDAGNTVVLLLPPHLLVAPSSEPVRATGAIPVPKATAPTRAAMTAAEPPGRGMPSGPVHSTYSNSATGGPALPRRRTSPVPSTAASQTTASEGAAQQATPGQRAALPRRGHGGQHMAPELRTQREPAPAQTPVDGYNPGLMAAFQHGQATAEHNQKPLPASTDQPGNSPLPPQESH